MRYPSLLLVLFALLLLPSMATAQVGITIEAEAGPVWQGSNTVEVPNDGTATRFALTGLTGRGAAPAGRFTLTWGITARHSVRALAAPLAISETGTRTAPIQFAGETFTADTPIDARYQFNSYRLTYRYRLLNTDSFQGSIGLTAKIRDAEVRLEQGDQRAFDDDLGVLPLVHLAAHWQPADRWQVRLEADALAGGPGRAVDAALTAGYDLSTQWTLNVGYRVLEGGADVPQVYNFALLHYALLSIQWRL